MIAKLLMSLAGDVVGIFGARGKAKQVDMAARRDAMERTWTDEFLTLFWCAPAVVAWFDPERAQDYLETVFGQSPEYVIILTGITAAVFGLGKLKTK